MEIRLWDPQEALFRSHITLTLRAFSSFLLLSLSERIRLWNSEITEAPFRLSLSSVALWKSRGINSLLPCFHHIHHLFINIYIYVYCKSQVKNVCNQMNYKHSPQPENVVLETREPQIHRVQIHQRDSSTSDLKYFRLEVLQW